MEEKLEADQQMFGAQDMLRWLFTDSKHANIDTGIYSLNQSYFNYGYFKIF